MPSTVGKKLFDRILYQHLNHDKEAPLVQLLYWVVYDAGQVKTSKYVIVCVMLLSYNLVCKTSGDFEKMCTLFEILIAVYPIFSG